MKRIISILALVGILFAQEKSELIIDIEQSLMATCCWSGTVYDHGNKEMELNITAMVGNGKTKTEILDYYTDQYGERVLAVPKAEGFNIFAWIAPIVIFGLANRKSVAWHVGRVLQEIGAEVLFVVRTPQRRAEVEKIVGPAPVFVCDVESEEEIVAVRRQMSVSPASP